MVRTKLLAWSLGILFVLTYLLCIGFGLILPSMRMLPLETLLPGFRWLTLPGFLIGLVESFFYGVYGGAVSGWVYNRLALVRQRAHGDKRGRAQWLAKR